MYIENDRSEERFGILENNDDDVDVDGDDDGDVHLDRIIQQKINKQSSICTI
jgi:hypothetical protein